MLPLHLRGSTGKMCVILPREALPTGGRKTKAELLTFTAKVEAYTVNKHKGHQRQLGINQCCRAAS